MGTQGAVQDYLQRSSDAKLATAKRQAASSPMSPIPGKPSKPSWQNMANMQKQTRPVAPPPATDGAPATPAVPNVPNLPAPPEIHNVGTFDDSIDSYLTEQRVHDNRTKKEKDYKPLPENTRAKTKKEAAGKLANNLMAGRSATGLSMGPSGQKATFPERGFYSPYADTPTRPGIPLSSPMDKTGRPIVKR
jgi:hypothetical protein